MKGMLPVEAKCLRENAPGQIARCKSGTVNRKLAQRAAKRRYRDRKNKELEVHE